MYWVSNCSQAIPFNQRCLSLMRHVSGYKSFLFDMRYYGSNQTQKTQRKHAARRRSGAARVPSNTSLSLSQPKYSRQLPRQALSIFHKTKIRTSMQTAKMCTEKKEKNRLSEQNKTGKKTLLIKGSSKVTRASGGHTSFIFHRCWRRSTIVFTTSIQGTHARAISTNKTWIPIYGFKHREVSTAWSCAAAVRRWFFPDDSRDACEETLALEHRKKTTDSLLPLTK